MYALTETGSPRKRDIVSARPALSGEALVVLLLDSSVQVVVS